MPTIFETGSFSALSSDQHDQLTRLFNGFVEDPQKKLHEINLSADPGANPHKHIYDNRDVLRAEVDFWKVKLRRLRFSEFIGMTDEERLAWREELSFGFYCLLAQYQLDKLEGRRIDKHGNSILEDYIRLLMDCQQLAKALDFLPKQGEEYLAGDSDLKYLGATFIAPELIKTVIEIQELQLRGRDGLAVRIVERLSRENVKRLYWVWGHSLLMGILDALPENFAYMQQAHKIIGMPARAASWASWIWYYLRLMFTGTLFAKHVIKSEKWMSKEEFALHEHTTLGERFATQAKYRKFIIINDMVWGSINLACFLGLSGTGLAGSIGNWLTLGLLLLDVIVASVSLKEEKQRFDETIARYTTERTRLLEELKKSTLDEETKKRMNAEIAILDEKIRKAQGDWDRNFRGLVSDLIYAICLMPAFAMLVCFFAPASIATSHTGLIIGAAGAAVCFALTLVNKIIKGVFEIKDLQADKVKLKREFAQMTAELAKIPDERQRPFFENDLQQLAYEISLNKIDIRYTTIKLIHAAVVDLMVPPLIFTTMLFLPLAQGIPILAGVLVLAGLAAAIIDKCETWAKSALIDPADTHSPKSFRKEPLSLGSLFAKSPVVTPATTQGPGIFTDLKTPFFSGGKS